MLVCCFHVILSCTCICELRIDFIFHTSLSCILTVKSAENKLRKVESTLLQGAGLYIAKNKTRLENKCEKSKESGKNLIHYYILGNNYINIIKRN